MACATDAFLTSACRARVTRARSTSARLGAGWPRLAASAATNAVNLSSEAADRELAGTTLADGSASVGGALSAVRSAATFVVGATAPDASSAEDGDALPSAAGAGSEFPADRVSPGTSSAGWVSAAVWVVSGAADDASVTAGWPSADATCDSVDAGCAAGGDSTGVGLLVSVACSVCGTPAWSAGAGDAAVPPGVDEPAESAGWLFAAAVAPREDDDELEDDELVDDELGDD